MRLPWRRATTCAVSLALFGACKEDTAPEVRIATVSVCRLDGAARICPAGSVLPLGTVEVTVAGSIGSRRIDRIVVTQTGLITRTDEEVLDPPASPPIEATFIEEMPPAVGVVTIIATLEAGTEQVTSEPVQVVVADNVPPTAGFVTLAPLDSLEPGDSVFVTVSASDNGALAHVVVQGTSGVTAADTVGQYTAGGTYTARFKVPDTTPYGTPVGFTIRAEDVAGLASPVVTTPTLTLADYTLPSVTVASVNGPRADPLLPGDTLRGSVTGSDNHRLAWAGFRIGQPVIYQDSFPVSTAAGTFAFSAVAAPGWVGIHPVKTFVRDSTGNLAENGFALETRVLDAVRRPLRSAAGQAAVADVAWDAKRQTLYLLQSSNVAVLPLGALVFGTPIPLPLAAVGRIDLTPSDDSLLFTLFPYSRTLGVIDLTTATPTVDTVPLSYDTLRGTPLDIAVTAGGRALVAIDAGATLDATNGALLEYDLATGAHALRGDVGTGGRITSQARLLPSGDRRRVAVSWARLPCCQTDEGQVYDQTGNGFSGVVVLPVGGTHFAAAAADSTGARYLIERYLLDGSLVQMASFPYLTSPAFPASAVRGTLSPDGQYGYFAQSVDESQLGTIAKVRLADAQLIERIIVPKMVRDLLVLPGGATLIAIATDNTVFVVEVE